MSRARFLPSLLTLAIAASLTVSIDALAAPAAAPAHAAAKTEAFTSANPFYAPSPLEYQAPQFDKIKDSDYAPALLAGMVQQRKEIDAIANNKAMPTFQNTIVAMERSGQLLTRVSKVFFALSQSSSNPAIEKIEADMAPKLSQHQDAITLNGKLFARIKTIYDQRAKLHLDPESEHLLEKYYDQFVHNGALLNDHDKQTIKGMNERLATLFTQFGQNVLASTKDGAVVVDDKAQLDGLSDADIAAASAAAKARGMDGKYLFPLQNTTTQPVLSSLKNRALREKIYRASIMRSDVAGPHDNRSLIAEVAKIRAERAKLLGYDNFAAYTLEDQMAKTPQAAIDLMTRVAKPAVAKAQAEAARIQQQIDQDQAAAHQPTFKLEPWDWQYYAEQVRKAEYDLDEAQIKPYFKIDTVLQDGVFFAANKMYGLTFKERHDLPVYNPDVRVFEVFNPQGKSIALFYFDYFARDSKHGGAWMDSFVDQSKLLGQHAVVFNVCNFTKPAPGQPALISFDDVTTMFHEFGHGLHGLLSNVEYPYFSGAATPRDFVEFPSQFNENWALEPTVFANYAKNYQTGAPMPAELVAKIKKSATFNQGYDTLEYVEAALLDMAWHQIPADAPLQNADSFEVDALKKYGVDVPQVPPRYRSTYFQHIWGNGYAAGYYAYLWTAVLAQDAFAYFNEHGGMTRANGQHFEDTVLSRGGTKDAHDLWMDFRGAEPSVEPYLQKHGLSAEPAKP
ncbi:MAG: M3 family metallopeptidase [Proteobacteria bacterium]|nr:M3 family metallopeptidase [Pseudomonadota bacterium]